VAIDHRPGFAVRKVTLASQRLGRVMRGYGRWLQFSVFQCRL
jgi:hypothetical protein